MTRNRTVRRGGESSACCIVPAFGAYGKCSIGRLCQALYRSPLMSLLQELSCDMMFLGSAHRATAPWQDLPYVHANLGRVLLPSRVAGWLMEGVDLRRIDAAYLPISDYDRTELVKLQAMGQDVYQGEMVLTPAISTLDPTGFSPVDIRLVPYSTAMLRWTVFPDKTAFK